MKLNTIIRLPDGRIGTICYQGLDGVGGVWGEHEFSIKPGEFGCQLIAPEFMLKEKEMEPILRDYIYHRADVECVGTDFRIIKQGIDL
uniref:Uncharacterized protein n=1 Tax=viral metagenome TaxID=1070528 RepID=A0A6M3JM17_9ZZZZ